MSVSVASPSPHLSGYVKQYYSVEASSGASEMYTHRIIPTGLTELMFYSGNLPKASDCRKHIPEGTILSGQQKGFYDLTISGALSLFSIVFKPHGPMAFFDFPLAEVYNRNVPFGLLIKNECSRLEAKLYESDTFTEKVMHAEQFLSTRLQKSKENYLFERIKYSIEKIGQNRGMIGINDLASKICLSRKQFERIFAEYVGSSPKQFLRTVRFQHALFWKSRYPNDSLTALAYDCGYYDQSHMSNEFRQLSGMSPKEFFSACKPESDFFS
ncbi:MAG: AraC family transcriptional regulator [Bacteroidota bacterium]